MALNRDWDSLAKQARERRTDLGMTQEDVAAAGGPSTATVRLIETHGAVSYRPKTYRQLEAALQLRPGSVRAALCGQPFRPLEEDQPAPPPPPAVDVTGLTDLEIQAIRNMADAIRRRARKDA